MPSAPSTRGLAPLDSVDRRILTTLCREARSSIADLAKDVSISRANAYARINRLREKGVIKRFTVELDPTTLGLEVAALIGIKLEFRSWRAVKEEIAAMPEVEYFAVSAGDFDGFILVRVPSMETIRDVILERLNAVEGIQSTKTFFILDEMHARPVLPPS